jgi:hypothetical protein
LKDQLGASRLEGIELGARQGLEIPYMRSMILLLLTEAAFLTSNFFGNFFSICGCYGNGFI